MIRGVNGGRPHMYRLVDGKPQRLIQVRVPFEMATTVKSIALLLDSGDAELIELLKRKGILP